MHPIVRIARGKETPARYGHPWIFSGAIETVEDGVADGDTVSLVDADGQLIGTGTCAPHSTIAVRIYDRRDVALDHAWFESAFRDAVARRGASGLDTAPGAAYRAVFAESDGVPGIVIDKYADVLVMQFSTSGAERLKGAAVDAAMAVFAPRSVIERSDVPSRKEDGLDDAAGVLFGPEVPEVRFDEGGSAFVARPMDGQKTGFYLDQRDLRSRIRALSTGRSVLNLFSYAGASGIAAMAGGASTVLNVDSSEAALDGCRRHAELNGVADSAFRTEKADVFQWLGVRREERYGVVVLDPPALIKSRKDAQEGSKAYHFLNRAAMRLVEDGGLFVSSSCSRHLSAEDLALILRKASVQAGIRLHVIERIGQPADHPVSLYFPESEYLTSFVCRAERTK